MKISRLKIIKGEDKKVTFFFKNASSFRPVNLGEVTNIQFIFEKADRSNITLDMTEIPAVKAYCIFNSGRFISRLPGALGNSIILQFDGEQTIDQVVNAWNLANTNNLVDHVGLIGSFVPLPGNIRLTEGLNAYTPVNIVNSDIGEVDLLIEDRVSNGLKIGDNQSFKVILDFGQPSQGTRRKARISNILDVSV